MHLVVPKPLFDLREILGALLCALSSTLEGVVVFTEGLQVLARVVIPSLLVVYLVSER